MWKQSLQEVNNFPKAAPPELNPETWTPCPLPDHLILLCFPTVLGKELTLFLEDFPYPLQHGKDLPDGKNPRSWEIVVPKIWAWETHGFSLCWLVNTTCLSIILITITIIYFVPFEETAHCFSLSRCHLFFFFPSLLFSNTRTWVPVVGSSNERREMPHGCLFVFDSF